MIPIREFGDYEILWPLNRRGYGTAFLARQKSLNRKVVLKILMGCEDRSLRRMREEAAMLAEFDDPRIVPVHEFGEEKGFPYLVTEYVEGLSLEDLLGRVRDRSPKDLDVREVLPDFSFARKDRPVSYHHTVLHMVVEIAEAMDKVHGHGIVHRNLKPGNILIQTTGLPRITDFGLARRGEDQSLSRGSMEFGLHAYASPEQLRDPGKPVDHRSDIFSLGVLLYELLSLRHPFRDVSAQETEANILAAQPAPLREWLPGIPRDLEAVVAHALEADPARRYTTAGDFARDLRHFLGGKEVEARPLGFWQRTGRWMGRRPMQILSLGVIAMLAAVTLWREDPMDQDTRPYSLVRWDEEEQKFRSLPKGQDVWLQIQEGLDRTLPKTD